MTNTSFIVVISTQFQLNVMEFSSEQSDNWRKTINSAKKVGNPNYWLVDQWGLSRDPPASCSLSVTSSSRKYLTALSGRKSSTSPPYQLSAARPNSLNQCQGKGRVRRRRGIILQSWKGNLQTEKCGVNVGELIWHFIHISETYRSKRSIEVPHGEAIRPVA